MQKLNATFTPTYLITPTNFTKTLLLHFSFFIIYFPTVRSRYNYNYIIVTESALEQIPPCMNKSAWYKIIKQETIIAKTKDNRNDQISAVSVLTTVCQF